MGNYVQTVFISGANRGIGNELALQLSHPASQEGFLVTILNG